MRHRLNHTQHTTRAIWPMWTHAGGRSNDDGAQSQPWTPEEDAMILQMVGRIGHKWSAIATLLPGRTDNGVRNRWNRLDR